MKEEQQVFFKPNIEAKLKSARSTENLLYWQNDFGNVPHHNEVQEETLANKHAPWWP